MKLYIPTSSRNFNCLFSEESISPKSFYGERGFGYSKWHDIPENPYDNLIVLYDELRNYERPNEGYDDYPLVIEVSLSEKDIAEKFLDDKKGAYLYDGTIYFNPKTTGIIFFDDKQRDIVLARAEGSLETKLVRIYHKRIRVEHPRGSYVAPEVQEAELNTEELANTIRLNKVKGFVYGYHIGSLLSVSKEQAFRVKTKQSLLNLASAIYGSIDKKPTPLQMRQLQQTILQDSSLARLLLTKTNLDFDTVSSLIEEILNQCKWEPSSYSPDKSALSLYSMIIRPESQEKAIRSLTEEISWELESSRAKIFPEKAKDISILADGFISLPVLKNNQEDKEIAELWINGEFADNKYKGSIASYRLDLATALTMAVRDSVYKDNWENSSARAFLNALRRNLNGEEFTEKWDEGILSAVAAVLMKGDSWDGLRLFLISKGIYNQTWAFAFWGLLNGFANLPKDFTSILLNQTDSGMLWKLLQTAVYEAINGFGIKVIEDNSPTTLEKSSGTGLKGVWGSIVNAASAVVGKQSKGEETETRVSEDIAEEHDDTYDDLPEIDLSVDQQIEDMPVFPEQEDKESRTATEHPYTMIWDQAQHIIENHTPKKQKEEYLKYYPSELDRVFERSFSLEAIRSGVEAIKPRYAVTAWKNAKGTINRIIKKQEDEENNMFRQLTPSVIDTLPCVKGLESKVIKRLNDNWKYTEAHSNDLNDHIDFFIRMSRKEGRGESRFPSPLRGFFKGDLAEQIERDLYQHFGIQNPHISG